MKFSLGTISSGAALFTVAVMMFFGIAYIYFALLLVYAVPCMAAYRKKPAGFWQPFTLVSVFGAASATFICAFGIRREIDDVELVGFPVAYVLSPELSHFPEVIVNAVLVS